MDVNSIQKLLGVAHSRVSQNLAILRSHRIVVERRQGRHVYYRLLQPRMAAWLLDGLTFLERELALNEEARSALDRVRQEWTSTTIDPDMKPAKDR
jgi:DNA-binding transcriptional ArsR family regulator